MKTYSIEFTENMLGKLNEQRKKEIYSYLNNPTYPQWEEIAHYIISGFTTIWQAVLDVDPTFSRQGRKEDFRGKIIRDWDRIPEPEIVIKAIQNVVYKTQEN